MMESYTDFAEVYDEFMDETPYETWCERIIRRIEQYGITKPYSEADAKGKNEEELALLCEKI